MQRNTGYFPTESLEPSGNRLFSRSALNEGYLFRGSIGYENQQSMAEKAPQIGYVGTFRIRPSRSMKKTIFLYRFFELFLRYFT